MIGGDFVDGGATFLDVENPSTEDRIAILAEADADEVDQAVSVARSAFETWSVTPPRERAQHLRNLADAIDRESEELALLETQDSGTPISQTRCGLIQRVAENFNFFANFVEQLEGRLYPSDGLLSYAIRKPIGVAGLITPWNLPLMLASWKIAPALAFGNTVVLKPAELAPMTVHRLAELSVEVGLPPGVFNTVQGRGKSTGEALVRHPGVDVISFTGATATGRSILSQGAATLKRFSMELGGKSPVLVFADADVERALDSAVFGIFRGNGQRCAAGSRILIEASIYDDFVGEFVRRSERIKVGDATDAQTEVGPLISAQHLKRVVGYVNSGISEGARLVCGGQPPADLDKGHYLAPTVFADVDNSMTIAQEEIFGPVACLLRFEDEDEALRLANDVRYGLASYIWTGDLARAHRLAPQIEAGMVWINSHTVRDLRTPFGGVKDSGYGREGGEYSMDTFTEVQNISIPTKTHHIPRWGADSTNQTDE